MLFFFCNAVAASQLLRSISILRSRVKASSTKTSNRQKIKNLVVHLRFSCQTSENCPLYMYEISGFKLFLLIIVFIGWQLFHQTIQSHEMGIRGVLDSGRNARSQVDTHFCLLLERPRGVCYPSDHSSSGRVCLCDAHNFARHSLSSDFISRRCAIDS